VTLHLVLVLAAFTSKVEAQEQIRKVEERLRQFPPPKVVGDFAHMSNEHICWLRHVGAAMPSHRREAYAAWLADAECLDDAWSYLDNAYRLLGQAKDLADGRRVKPILFGSFPEETVEGKLACAQKCITRLKTLLGEEAFIAGRMPPPVPYWRFQWID
jgi:hypothetical protein